MSFFAAFILLTLVLGVTLIIGVWVGLDVADDLRHEREAVPQNELNALRATQRLAAAAWTARQRLFEAALEAQRRSR